jgi:hypothetical protein
MLPDPVTGYLQRQRNDLVGKTFTPEKKLDFLRLVKDYIDKHQAYPPLHTFLKALGVGMRTLQNHLANDQIFKSDYKELLHNLQVIYTQKLGDKADAKQGTLANLAMLRYLESGTWNPSGLNPISQGAPSKELLSSFGDAIDAEIVPETSAKPGQLENNTPPENHLNRETH